MDIDERTISFFAWMAILGLFAMLMKDAFTL
jgi:hypothetical protein